MSARRRSIAGAEAKIFAEADANRDGFLDFDEFKQAFVLLKASEKKPMEADDDKALADFNKFLDMCIDDGTLLLEMYDEIRKSKGESSDLGVSLNQWQNAEFFEDDD